MNPILVMVIPMIFGLGMLLFGGLVIYGGLAGQRKGRAARDWPAAPGRVTAAEIKITTLRGRKSYRPQIEYDYNVQGVPYHASLITYAALPANQTTADAYLARYPVGSAVSVYYNPQKPEEAVLEKTSGGLAPFIIAGAILGIIGLCVACSGAVGLSSLWNGK